MAFYPPICRICHRANCVESFHSLEEQEKYEEKDGKLVLKKEFREEEDGDE